MMREFFFTKMEEKHILCDLIERIKETGKIVHDKVVADHNLQEQQQTFTETENWPPNSTDLNPVDYSVCGPL